MGDELFSCAGKADGNYPHPTDPTKFMSCVAGTNAYERDCQPRHYVYVPEVDACLPPEEAAAYGRG